MIAQEIKDFIKNSFNKTNVICLTGAGTSAESGIPTFRGKGGLWEKYNPEIYANTEGLISVLRKHPQDLVNFIVDFYSVLLKAKPNPAHLALSDLEKAGILSSVITQNIDNLHQEAGSRNVIELHGNAFKIRCMRCSKSIKMEKERLKEMIELLQLHRNSRIRLMQVLSHYFPRCHCGSRYRIDIVLFGEMLSQNELVRAYRHLDRCNVLLIVGSSLVVYPAANIPLYAKERGAKLIEINNEKTAFSGLCDYRIRTKASEACLEILELIKD